MLVWHGGNIWGKKGNKGGALKRNQFGIDWSQFEDMAARLEEVGADIKSVFTDLMEQEAETVQEYTIEATAKAHLPAQGKYSQNETIKAIDRSPKVEWSGTLGSVGMGFDKTKPNAGTFLITGTPRMKPDYELEKIYVQKSFKRQIIGDINDFLEDTLEYMANGGK